MASTNKIIKSLADLAEGDIIAEPVISHNGYLLAHSTTVVTQVLIKKFKEWRITEVPITCGEAVAAENLPSEQRTAIADFNVKYNDAVEKLKEVFAIVRATRQIPGQDLRDVSQHLLAMALTNVGILERIALLPRTPIFAYEHAANVAMLSAILGRWMDCNVDQIRALVLGGILHDIGRCFLSPHLFSKYYMLTDEEKAEVETHCVKAYRLIEATKYIDPVVKYIVLQHHELVDGSGYPCKIKEQQIHPLAKIVGFADYFDLLMFKQGITKRLSPHQVIEQISMERHGKLCPVSSGTFLRRCSDLILGGTVQLNDGTLGRVVFVDPYNPNRPVLQVGPDFFIDLSKETELHIHALLSEFTDVPG